MNGDVTRLYPSPVTALKLEGLYLNHRLHRLSGPRGLPYLYTNFITSLDGRISLPDPQTGLHQVPPALANPRDHHLYLQLAAQADLLLTTARHLRAVAEGRHHEVLQLGAHALFAPWRRSQGLSPQPAVAAVSEQLAIPIKALRTHYAGTLLVITGKAVSPTRVAALRNQGVEVMQLNGATLDGLAVTRALAARGFQRIYSIAGPRVTHALLESGVVARLYLTLSHLALGGRDFSALTFGEPFATPPRFVLHQLYFDPCMPVGAGQLFACFNANPCAAIGGDGS